MTRSFLLLALLTSTALCAGELKLLNGRTVTYTKLKLKTNQVYASTKTGGRTLSWAEIDPNTLPYTIRGSIRDKLLEQYLAANKLYRQRRYPNAIAIYRRITACYRYFDKETIKLLKEQNLGRKARGLIEINGQWVNYRQEVQDRKQARAREMAKKGLVEFRGKWITRERRQELIANEKGAKIARSKMLHNAPFRVVEPAPLTICELGYYDKETRRVRFGGNVIGIRDLPPDQNKVDQEMRKNLYWVGSGRWHDGARFIRIQIYALSLERAAKWQIARLGLLPQKASGTGFAITKAGHIVTNSHVVDDALSIHVEIAGKLQRAEVLAKDEENDIAILKVDAATTPVALATEDEGALGQTIFTVGYPAPNLQGKTAKVTKGVISALSGVKGKANSYQIDVAVQNGNSGGALADANGNVVGIVNAKVNLWMFVMQTGALPENVNYAIKKRHLVQLLEAHPEIAEQMPAPAAPTASFEEAVKRVHQATCYIEVSVKQKPHKMPGSPE